MIIRTLIFVRPNFEFNFLYLRPCFFSLFIIYLYCIKSQGMNIMNNYQYFYLLLLIFMWLFYRSYYYYFFNFPVWNQKCFFCFLKFQLYHLKMITQGLHLFNLRSKDFYSKWDLLLDPPAPDFFIMIDYLTLILSKIDPNLECPIYIPNFVLHHCHSPHLIYYSNLFLTFLRFLYVMKIWMPFFILIFYYY
jgi:hypothetical protein